MRPGPPPEGDNRTALFIVDKATRNVPILCRPGDELRLRLPENASTGYIWQVLSPRIPSAPRPRLSWDGRESTQRRPAEGPPTNDAGNTGASLRLAQDRYVPFRTAESDGDRNDATLQRLAQPGTRELVFLADGPGRAELTVSLSRPWEADELDAFSTVVRIGPTHMLNGFAEGQTRAHVARVAVG
jgi:predicted secreted protein